MRAKDANGEHAITALGRAKFKFPGEHLSEASIVKSAKWGSHLHEL